jgi:hypothetical protein
MGNQIINYLFKITMKLIKSINFINISIVYLCYYLVYNLLGIEQSYFYRYNLIKILICQEKKVTLLLLPLFCLG